MSLSYQEIDGLSVRVDKVVYMPTLDAPDDKPYPFVYFLTIENQSNEKVRILGRKWVVRERTGETCVVEGEGVVGQLPQLVPGDPFSYNSYHVVAVDAEVSGAFFGITEKGQAVRVMIPRFELQIPGWA